MSDSILKISHLKISLDILVVGIEMSDHGMQVDEVDPLISFVQKTRGVQLAQLGEVDDWRQGGTPMRALEGRVALFQLAEKRATFLVGQ